MHTQNSSSEVRSVSSTSGEARPAGAHEIAGLVRRVFRFALPSTAIMLLSGLFLIVDTYFVARLSEATFAGVSLVFPLYLILITVLGGGIGVGIGVVIAVRLGREDRAGAQRAVGSALAMAVGLALCFAALFLVGGRWMFSRMTSSQEVIEAAMRFGLPLFLGCPILAVSLTMTNLLRSEQRLGGAVAMLLVGGAVNAALISFLIHGALGVPGLGVAGAGVSTILGFAVAMVLGVFLFGGPGRLSVRPRDLRIAVADITEIVSIAFPTIATYVVSNVALMSLTAIWAGFGTDALASFGLASRLEYMILLGTYGFGGAIMTLGGEAWGAGRYPEFARISAITGVSTAIIGTVVAALVLRNPAAWFQLFGSVPQTTAAGARYLHIAAFAYPFFAMGSTLNYSYQTIARAYTPLVYAGIRCFFVAVPVAGAAMVLRAPVEVAAAGVAGSLVLHGLLTALRLRGEIALAVRRAQGASTKAHSEGRAG